MGGVPVVMKIVRNRWCLIHQIRENALYTPQNICYFFIGIVVSWKTFNVYGTSSLHEGFFILEEG